MAPPLSGESPNLSSHSHASAPTGSALSHLRTVEAALNSRHVPVRDVHLPDLPAAGAHLVGPVRLTYLEAPAPMGVADIGVRNVSGRLEPYSFNTTTVRGTVELTSAQSLYVAGDGPDRFGVELNAVLTNVTLFGNSTYQFWMQDLVSYTSSSGELTFGDDIWNFSNHSGFISANAIYSHGPNGTLVAPIFYYATGPTFTVHYPFSVTFYLNSTLEGVRPVLFFNYSVASRERNASGSFDYVIFNSTAGPPSWTPSVPLFQVNGFGYNPFGLVNDIELVTVGNGDGDTTTFVQMNGTLSLQYWNATQRDFVSVPSAYDVGTDSGETSNGVASFYETPSPGASPAVRLLVGPSFLVGLWNVSSDSGCRFVADYLDPPDAFVFVNPGGSFDAQTAQWAPTVAPGAVPSVIAVPNPGEYFVETMLSEYTPTSTTFEALPNTTTSFYTVLGAESALGIYTPMIIWGNDEFPTLSVTGNGTTSAPYVLPNNQLGPLDNVFAQWNDFEFPVFPGLLLVHTTAWVTITPPSFAIAFLSSWAPELASLGLPATDALQIQFYMVSNATLRDCSSLSGWFSADLSSFPEGAVLLWDSSDNLIAGNTFYDQGTGLALYGGTGNTVWGNQFVPTPTAATNPEAVMASGSATLAINESESGDLIYNNYIATPLTAYTPTLDPLLCKVECEPASYVDAWNVSLAPATNSLTVLGTVLTGSIIGTSYQGGNFWANYGTPADPYGVLPYNNQGMITNGGDYLPLMPHTLYGVTFQETGLPSGAAWNVTALGFTTDSNTSSLVVYAPNGTGSFIASTPLGYTANGPATFTVNGTPLQINLTFVPLGGLQFEEEGLTPGWTWTIAVDAAGGALFWETNTTSAGFGVSLPVGNYTTTFEAYGYTPNRSNVSVALRGETLAIGVIFTPTPGVTFLETGLAAGTGWGVSLHQGSLISYVSSTGATLSFTVLTATIGPFTFNVSAPLGYAATPSSGSGSYPHASVPVEVNFSAIPGTLNGTVLPVNATVTVGGAAVSLAGGRFSVSLAPGVWSIEATAPGYFAYFNNVSVTSGATTLLEVSLTAVPSPTTAPNTGAGYPGWVVIGALAVLVLLLVLTVYHSRRPRAPPPRLAPAPGTVPSAVEGAQGEPSGEGDSGAETTSKPS